MNRRTSSAAKRVSAIPIWQKGTQNRAAMMKSVKIRCQSSFDSMTSASYCVCSVAERHHRGTEPDRPQLAEDPARVLSFHAALLSRSGPRAVRAFLHARRWPIHNS